MTNIFELKHSSTPQTVLVGDSPEIVMDSTPKTSEEIDTQGYEGCTFIITSTEVLTDGDVIDISFTESDDSGGSFTDVIDSEILKSALTQGNTLSGDFINNSLGNTLATPFAEWATDVAKITTTSAHSYQEGDEVTVAVTGATGYDGTFIITSVPTTTTFTYTLVGDPGGTPSAGTTILVGFSDLLKTKSFGYIGKKRYVKLVLTEVAGANSATFLSTTLLSQAHHQPTT